MKTIWFLLIPISVPSLHKALKKRMKKKQMNECMNEWMYELNPLWKHMSWAYLVLLALGLCLLEVSQGSQAEQCWPHQCLERPLFFLQLSEARNEPEDVPEVDCKD